MAFIKTCKYCDLVKIQWNDSEGKYIEVDSKEQHTKERCLEAQAKASTHSTQQTKGYFKTGQDQKSEDIKAAQKERREQHRELIITMKNLTKAIVYSLAHTSTPNQSVDDIVNDIGFEQYREDQQSFQDEVV